MNTVYPKQALDRLVRLSLSRDSAMLGVRPLPPKPVSLVAGVLTWEEPKQTANITHYKIYLGRGVLFQKVPVGQTKLIGFTETKAFLTSVDDRSGLESHEFAVTGTAASTGGGATPPGDSSGITVSGFVDPVTAAMTLKISVTPGAAPFIGVHLYLEIPDQSTKPALVVGSSTVGGTSAVTGPWSPLDIGKETYAASQQPWTVKVPAPPGLDLSVDIPCRLYAVSFSTDVENKLVQAGLTGASPNQTFTLVSLASSSPTSGTNVTTLTVASGTHVGIVATALAPDNSTGKLKTPVLVIVTDTPLVKGWAFRLVVTIGAADPTVKANQFVVSGVFNKAGEVQASADGVSMAHSFLLDTPTAVTTAIVWLQAGLVDSAGVFQGNNIVPGITPSFPITYGSTVGTTDASAIMAATINASMAVTAGLFGVAANGIATFNLQNLAVTTPIIDNIAVTNAKIANLAVGAAQIILATITGAQIASATIAGANIGNATIAQANIANLAVGTAQLQNLAVTDAKINTLSASKITAGTISATISITSPIISATDGTTTVNIDATNFVKVSTPSSQSQLNAATVRTQNSTNTRWVQLSSGGNIQGTDLNGLWQLNGAELLIPALPSANPGAGTKQFWYDPADSNRVKYAP